MTRGPCGSSMAPPMCLGSELLGEGKEADDDGLGQALRVDVSPLPRENQPGRPRGQGGGSSLREVADGKGPSASAHTMALSPACLRWVPIPSPDLKRVAPPASGCRRVALGGRRCHLRQGRSRAFSVLDPKCLSAFRVFGPS